MSNEVEHWNRPTFRVSAKTDVGDVLTEGPLSAADVTFRIAESQRHHLVNGYQVAVGIKTLLAL